MNKIVNATDTLIPAPKDGQDGKPGQPGRPGTDGKPGPPGPAYCPAGKFDINTEYERTSFQVPFVEHDSQYYYLNKVGKFKGIDPAKDYAANGKNATWVLGDKIKLAIIEAVVAEFGKIASAVFWNDFMLSQYGINAEGEPVETADGYKAFTPSMDNFIPNVLLNFLTGYAHFSKGNAKFHPDGTVEIVGKFTAEDKAAKTRIIIDPNSSGIKLYQIGKPEPVASLSFEIDTDQVARPVLQMSTMTRTRVHYDTTVRPTIINMAISSGNGNRRVQLDANRLYFTSNDVNEQGQPTNHRFREFSINNP